MAKPRPVVALVGRPNVGKSTLFNRLAGERLAVVDAVPGTTRDRLVAETEWNGVVFDVVDTGGIDPTGVTAPGKKPLSVGSAQFIDEIRRQAQMAVQDADAVLFLVDVESGVTPADREVADILRRYQRQRDGKPFPPIILAVNKCDTVARFAEAAQFYELGLGEPHPISAQHGTGVGDLLDALVEVLPPAPPVDEDDESVAIAIVGKPNVGKSSLLNRLLGEERSIVSPIPGTTRDAVDTHLTYDGTPITLIDTAGIRRRGRIEPGVEKYSVLRSFRAIRRADVALLVLDATTPISAQDAHIAGFVLEAWKSVVVVVNKWDAVEKDTYTMQQYVDEIRQKLHFLDYVPILFVSAKTGQRVHKILPTALQVNEARLTRLPTSYVNRILREAQDRHPPPTKGGRMLKIYFGSQVSVAPPTFVLQVNDPKLMHFTYLRYLENRIREAHPFPGTPIRLVLRKKNK
ncbi:MAG: ribosome biogenesis GTPase Der [Chloroflexi bacterium]|nr:ribosome biogenesis GTPase Der [Chloroflexota bacterium]